MYSTWIKQWNVLDQNWINHNFYSSRTLLAFSIWSANNSISAFIFFIVSSSNISFLDLFWACLPVDDHDDCWGNEMVCTKDVAGIGKVMVWHLGLIHVSRRGDNCDIDCTSSSYWTELKWLYKMCKMWVSVCVNQQIRDKRCQNTTKLARWQPSLN